MPSHSLNLGSAPHQPFASSAGRPGHSTPLSDCTLKLITMVAHSHCAAELAAPAPRAPRIACAALRPPPPAATCQRLRRQRPHRHRQQHLGGRPHRTASHSPPPPRRHPQLHSCSCWGTCRHPALGPRCPAPPRPVVFVLIAATALPFPIQSSSLMKQKGTSHLAGRPKMARSAVRPYCGCRVCPASSRSFPGC
jgi:hypothetical protein